jgi:hypothetical protein
MAGNLYEGDFTLMKIYRPVLLKMKNISNKSCRRNKNTHFMFSNLFQRIVLFMRQCGQIFRQAAVNMAHVRKHTPAPVHAHTHTHTAYSRQEWFLERTSILRYTCIASPVYVNSLKVYIYIYIYIYTHTHTQTHTHIGYMHTV